MGGWAAEWQGADPSVDKAAQEALAAAQKKKAELARKEDQERKAKQVQIIQDENKAVTAIKSVSNGLNQVQPEGLEALIAKVNEALGKELEKCGSRKAKVKEETEKAIEM